LLINRFIVVSYKTHPNKQKFRYDSSNGGMVRKNNLESSSLFLVPFESRNMLRTGNYIIFNLVQMCYQELRFFGCLFSNR